MSDDNNWRGMGKTRAGFQAFLAPKPSGSSTSRNRPNVDMMTSGSFDEKPNEPQAMTGSQTTNDQRPGIPQNTLLLEIPTLETVGEEDEDGWRERVELVFDENDVENETRREQLLQKATNIVNEFVNNQPERMEMHSK